MRKTSLRVLNQFRGLIMRQMCKSPTKNTCGPPPATPALPFVKKQTGCGSSLAADTQCCVPTKACQPPSVAINGFGRIGKCLLRLAAQNDFDVSPALDLGVK